MEERVGAGGHGDGDDAFLLRLALIEGEIQRPEGFVFAEDFDDSIRQSVDRLDTHDGAVKNEIARLVEDDVDLSL